MNRTNLVVVGVVIAVLVVLTVMLAMSGTPVRSGVPGMVSGLA